MSRRLLLRIMPPIVAGMAGVYSGFAFFDPIFREERNRLIREGIIVLPDHPPSHGQPQGAGTPIKSPAPPSVTTETVIKPVKPPLVSSDVSLPDAQASKSFVYSLVHPSDLFSSRDQNTSGDSLPLKEAFEVAIDQAAPIENEPAADSSADAK
ncbi:hypothetical protein V1520DRAFT_345734 [Lipomyces starkeyi]|uniref:Uncharacterized protein n=1 Tax=Lipomyces starkeyi NRRL Y-11557 TaxID=675824 RepID=A0A1E3PZG2_LIPST|nr:hypothetical protein LIPSTDRAFT_65284 [Lipomyces starkeyi NRRL Y-11557]